MFVVFADDVLQDASLLFGPVGAMRARECGLFVTLKTLVSRETGGPAVATAACVAHVSTLWNTQDCSVRLGNCQWRSSSSISTLSTFYIKKYPKQNLKDAISKISIPIRIKV
uniref:Uncharacterized protein n=1 Tax=Homalodisca liturata TaxID=320908 RepID=A0A1B6J6E2_9HEMI